MILSINNTTKIVQSISILHSSCISPLFEIEVLPDCKQNNINRFHLFHDGLGLPDKLYYKDSKIVKKYKQFIVSLFTLLKKHSNQYSHLKSS